MTSAPYAGVDGADTMVSPLRVMQPMNRRPPAVDWPNTLCWVLRPFRW